jgi:hypothetical protein
VEYLHEALIEAIKACGGTKRIAALLWPAKANQNLEAARRYLANCLNPDCNEKLSLEEVMLVLRTARQAGNHSAMQYLCEALSYAEPQPIEPKDEADELRRQFIESTRTLAKMAERIEQLERPVRAVA